MTTELEEKLEEEFVSLVKNSWKIYRKYSWNNSVDEILIGAVIRSNLDKGYLLIDLKSNSPYYSLPTKNDPSSSGYKVPINKHFLRFSLDDEPQPILHLHS